MIVGVLEVFEANWDELFQMTWGSGVFVDVCDDKFQVRHWLGKSVEVRLQQVELTNSCECLIKVGDLRQLIHVLSNVADDLGIIDALIAQAFPDHQQFAMRRVCGVVESSGTTVEDAD